MFEVIDPTLFLIGGLLLMFIAFALLIFGFVPDEVEEDEVFGYRLTKRQRLIDEDQAYQVTLAFVKLFAHYIRKIPEGDNWVENLRRSLREKLPRSGFIGAFTPNEFLGMCFVSSLYTFVALLLLSTLLAGSPNLPIAGIVGAAAISFPYLSLSGAIQERLAEIDRRLPYTIDLLVLSMNAGLDFMSALDRVVMRGQQQNPDDPMIQELGVVLQEMRVGTPKSDALLNLCERVNSEYLKSMVGAILQSEKRGTPLAKVLEIQVDTIRNKRTQRIEKAASQAAVKILLPLMFIFGAVIVVVVGAMILKIKGNTG
ncbi:MAG: type II secretion system F family protein [Myxococcota bacterium]